MEQPDPRNYKDSLQNAILILDTPVLGIELPLEIVAAINRQTQQFYEIQEFKYRVEREAQESRRKQIEANGIAAFQQTVSKGISDSYLRWRGIEATLALAQSQNAKIVIIGGGKDGLPIILGNVDGAPVPSTVPTNNGPGGLLSVPVAPSTGSNKPLTSGASPPPTVDKNPPIGQTPKQTTGSSSVPVTDAQSKSYVPHDLADLEGLLGRIYDALRAPNSASNSGTAPQSKESAAGSADRPSK
jgi:hypothetical protein